MSKSAQKLGRIGYAPNSSVLLWGSAAGWLVMLVLGLARSTRGGSQLDTYAEYSIGGRYASWLPLAHVLGVLPVLAAVTMVVGLVAVGFPERRAGAVFCWCIVLIANGGSQFLKLGLSVLDPSIGTLPSGHATLALSMALALVALSDARCRGAAWLMAGFLATWGCLGVVLAYWHRPGDVLAALVLMPFWTWIVVGLTRIVCRPGRHHVRAVGPARSGLTTPDLLPWYGAAVCLVTMWGWGFAVKTDTFSHLLLGLALFLLLPAVCSGVIRYLARVAECPEGAAH